MYFICFPAKCLTLQYNMSDFIDMDRETQRDYQPLF